MVKDAKYNSFLLTKNAKMIFIVFRGEMSILSFDASAKDTILYSVVDNPAKDTDVRINNGVLCIVQSTQTRSCRLDWQSPYYSTLHFAK